MRSVGCVVGRLGVKTADGGSVPRNAVIGISTTCHGVRPRGGVWGEHISNVGNAESQSAASGYSMTLCGLDIGLLWKSIILNP